jgi:hypothetical protein
VEIVLQVEESAVIPLPAWTADRDGASACRGGCDCFCCCPVGRLTLPIEAPAALPTRGKRDETSLWLPGPHHTCRRSASIPAPWSTTSGITQETARPVTEHLADEASFACILRPDSGTDATWRPQGGGLRRADREGPARGPCAGHRSSAAGVGLPRARSPVHQFTRARLDLGGDGMYCPGSEVYKPYPSEKGIPRGFAAQGVISRDL